jgi:DNA-binding HxlR family transcriptional regulator
MPDTTSHTDPLEISAPHRELLDQVLDKWSVIILGALCEKPARFNELRRRIDGITQRALTQCLRRLERNGIIERKLLSSRPVAIEYRITSLGKTLRHPIDVLLEWAAKHMPNIEQARETFDVQHLAEDN